jgi:hypothetical protein
MPRLTPSSFALRHLSKWGEQRGTPLSNRVSVVHGCVRDADLLPKLFEVDLDPVVFIFDGISAVEHLFFFGCPPTVLRAVALVVVDPVDGHSGWALPHVGKKVFKGLPPVANSYSPPSVVTEAFDIGVFTPLPHPAPNIVCARVALTVLTIIPAVSFFVKQTATGVGSTVPDVCSISIGCLAAVASATPYHAAFRPTSNRSKRNETPEPFTCEVNKSRVSRIVKLHIGNSNRNCCRGVWLRSQERHQQCMAAQ